MKWFEDYQHELKLVFDTAADILGALPAPFAESGMEYLRKFNPLEKESAKNYICYLLPYWLQQHYGADDALCRRLSVSNVLVMLYYFLQDDLMDTPQNQWKEMLALANLIHAELLKRYREDFSSASPFWPLYEQYIREWSAAVTSEERQGDFRHAGMNVAHKASPVKLASSGLLIHMNQLQEIPLMSSVIDHVLFTLQLADDWADWEEDWTHGNYNCLISLAQAEYHSSGPFTEEHIRNYIYIRNGLTAYVEAASVFSNQLEELPARHKAQGLYAFHDYLMKHLRSSAEHIAREKELLMQGGFFRLLSQSPQV